MGDEGSGLLPPPFAMVALQVRQLVRDLLVTLRGQHRSVDEIEQLARDIVEYGRMIREDFPEGGDPSVSTRDIAYRFREKPKDVGRALLLLTSRGQARPAAVKNYWHLK